MTPAPLDMRLVSCVMLDPRTVMLTVRELSTEKRWFRTIEHEQVKKYTMSIGVGRFMDGDRYILRQDPRHFRLWELFGAWSIEQRLDKFIELEEPVKYALPPVPVMPRR